jgi:hypothetical protein
MELTKEAANTKIPRLHAGNQNGGRSHFIPKNSSEWPSLSADATLAMDLWTEVVRLLLGTPSTHCFHVNNQFMYPGEHKAFPDPGGEEVDGLSASHCFKASSQTRGKKICLAF